MVGFQRGKQAELISLLAAGGSELAERDLGRSLRLEDERAHGFDVL